MPSIPRMGSTSPITYVPYDQAYEPGFEDMPRRVPCLEKLEQLTGFRPATSLSEIIDRVVSHFQRKREGDFVAAGRAGRAEGAVAP
jgi:nucleoside-diphosphate-sugar epimerase